MSFCPSEWSQNVIKASKPSNKMHELIGINPITFTEKTTSIRFNSIEENSIRKGFKTEVPIIGF